MRRLRPAVARRERRLAGAALACLVVGALVLLLASGTALRAAGAVVMLGFVVLGALAVLTPGYLGQDPDR